MKPILLFAFIFSSTISKAQTVKNIYVDLYTDSLKRGTYNYINVDGLLPNGHYLPLDSTDLTFTSSAGKFYGNSLWIDPNFTEKKVSIKVTLKQNPSLHKEFEMYIKQKPDGPLKTVDELMNEMKSRKKKRNG